MFINPEDFAQVCCHDRGELVDDLSSDANAIQAVQQGAHDDGFVDAQTISCCQGSTLAQNSA